MRGRLHELDGDLPAAATTYAEDARRATNVAERDHLVRRATRARAGRAVLGDNTAGSFGSRGFRPVPEREIVGEVRMVIPAAVVPAGLAAAVLLGAGLVLVALGPGAGSRGGSSRRVTGPLP